MCVDGCGKHGVVKAVVVVDLGGGGVAGEEFEPILLWGFFLVQNETRNYLRREQERQSRFRMVAVALAPRARYFCDAAGRGGSSVLGHRYLLSSQQERRRSSGRRDVSLM